MRKFFALSIIAVLFLNLFGFYIAFTLNQKEIKDEMMGKAAMESPAHLHLFSFSQEEFNHLEWTEKGKEFSYNGRLFDISRIEISGQLVRLYVEEDAVENQLIDDFVSLVRQEQQNGHTNSPIRSLLSSLFNEFTITSVAYAHFPCRYMLASVSYKDTLYYSFISDSQSPPPDLTLS